MNLIAIEIKLNFWILNDSVLFKIHVKIKLLSFQYVLHTVAKINPIGVFLFPILPIFHLHPRLSRWM